MKSLDELLAHPIRERVLTELLGHSAPRSAVEVSKQTGIALGTVAYHFRELADAGLISVESTRQRRGATETFYHPSEDRLEDVETAVESKIASAKRLLVQVKREIG